MKKGTKKHRLNRFVWKPDDIQFEDGGDDPKDTMTDAAVSLSRLGLVIHPTDDPLAFIRSISTAAKTRQLSLHRRTIQMDMSSPWQPFQGAKGGHGWRNASTGEVRYQQNRPESRGEGGGEQPAAESKPHDLKLDQPQSAKPSDVSGQAAPKPGPDSKVEPVKKSDFPVTAEKTVPPPTGKVYAPNTTLDRNHDGMTETARVGVPGNVVPPPPKRLPRLPNLTPDERAVETGFAARFEKDPDGIVKLYDDARNAGKIGEAPNVFGTDDVKALDPHWTPPEGVMSEDEIKNNRAKYNLALHQTANAVAKRSFLKHLDTLQGDKKTVLVTNGGCGAGKGFAIQKVGAVSSLKDVCGAVWDSAGDQNATENEWIQQECEKRGIKVTYAYIHADPYSQWADPNRGVVQRANASGRMVDADVFADSYAIGAKNFKAFHAKHKDNPNANFFFIDNTKGAKPQQVDEMPEEATKLDRSHLYNFAVNSVAACENCRPAVKRGATMGLRVWGHEHE